MEFFQQYMLESRVELFCGLTRIPILLIERTGDVLLQYPEKSQGMQITSLADTYIPMITSGEMLLQKAYVWPVGSTAYHAIIPLEEDKLICFGPVFPQNVTYETCLQDMNDSYSSEDIWQLYNLASNAVRMDVVNFCKCLTLFLNYVVKRSCTLEDVDHMEIVSWEGKDGQSGDVTEEETFSYKDDRELLKAIRQGNEAVCGELVKNRVFFQTPEASAQDIRSLRAEVVSYMTTVLYSAIEGGLPQQRFGEILSEMSCISSISQVEQFEEWLRKLICDICRQVSMWKAKSTPPSELDKCLAYIDANPYHKYTVDELADTLGISRSTINRYFKKNLDTTPAKYIMDIRLKEAERLLRTSKIPISEIAYSLGFSSQSHFSKCFTEKYQKTPFRYRNGFGDWAAQTDSGSIVKVFPEGENL